VATVYYFHNQSIRRILAIEAVRQKVARDLHDDIGSALSTINILSIVAKNKIKEDPLKAEEYISKIGDNSTRMMEAMDDIVWSINPENDNMQKIISRMRQFATEVLEPKNIELDFLIDEQTKELHLNMQEKRDLFLVFKEAINNIAKYANATLVKTKLSLNNNKLVLYIEDNGEGFDIENADGGNGLNNMQKRAEALNAKFKIASMFNSGTTVTLEMDVT
jgi:signal transduction histidine kinase